MKETTRNTLKKIGKVIAVYYAIEITAAAIMMVVNTIMVGWEPTKRILKNALAHTKAFYKNLFRGKFKAAVKECTDAELDGAYVNIQSRCGKEAADGFMEAMYDGLEGVIPFSRKRCPADKKPVNGVNKILEEMIRSGEINTVHLDEFESRPIDETKVPEDIRRRAE